MEAHIPILLMLQLDFLSFTGFWHVGRGRCEGGACPGSSATVNDGR